MSPGSEGALRAAARLLEAMSAPGSDTAARLAPLLHADAGYAALGRTLAGRAAVLDELCSSAQRAAWAPLQWSAPEPAGPGSARLSGRAPEGGRQRGLVVGVHTAASDADDAVITRIELQRLPAPPVPATPLRLDAALRAAIDGALVGRHPMLMACVAPDGQPVLSFRGSVQVFADDALAIWVRNAEGLFIRAIRENPRVALMYRDEERKATYQFQGRARVADDEATRRAVFERSPAAERAHDFARLGVAVVVELDRVEGYAGLGPDGQIDAVRMLRDAR